MIFKLNPEQYRQDFPVLQKGYVYMDSACMSLKPVQVINKLQEYYTQYPACGGRSGHRLAEQVTLEVLKARKEVKEFINAKEDAEIIFTRNTTEGINILANGLGLEKGDEVILSDKEHNSNLIPWLKLKKEKGIHLSFVPSKQDNTFDLETFQSMVSERTKLVSVVHTSNLDGVTNPVKDIIRIAHRKNALVMLDAAQSAPHKELDVRSMDADFMAFSGHKMLGPTGTGAFYGKRHLLEKLDMFMVGGETVLDSNEQEYVPEHLPHRFEAGLQDYAGILGFAEACRYLKKAGLGKIEDHEMRLNKLITESLAGNPRIRILGPQDAKLRGGIFSFIIKDMDPHHVSRMLDRGHNIMTRSGAHCVHSWFNKHALKGSSRASLYLYNTEQEAEQFAHAVQEIAKF